MFLAAPHLQTCILKSKGCFRYYKCIYSSVCKFSSLPSKQAIAAAATARPAVTSKVAVKDAAPVFSSTSGNVLEKAQVKATPPDPLTSDCPPVLFVPHSQQIFDLADRDALLHLRHAKRTVCAGSATSERLTLLNALTPKDLEWHHQVLSLRALPKHYMSLSKIRLTGLVVITTLAGYAMAPGVFDPSILLLTVLGTGLTSCAANAINQFLEIPYDSQMNRTKNRVLVRGFLSPLHALTLALCSATLGITTLYFGVNGLTAALGATNLFLYTAVYTPMKRYSILNTWVGSVVGAIPPMMGWAACTGNLEMGAWLMGALLYSWQFPHFNALSWNLRPDYSRAGYRMMSVTNPALCRRTALRHSVIILALCSLAPYTNLTNWTFAADSLPLNLYLVYCAWRFYKEADSASSRKLFRLSLIHLPALIILMLISKVYVNNTKQES